MVVNAMNSIKAGVVNLLMLEEDGKCHYVWIKNMSRLLSAQVSNHGHTLNFCYRCLQHFTANNLLKKHEALCSMHRPTTTLMPEIGDNRLFFESIHKANKCNFVLYYDFECNIIGNDKIHEPCGFAYILVSTCEQYSKDAYIYRGRDAGKKFLQCISDEMDYVESLYALNENMFMTLEEEDEYLATLYCYLCGQTFTLEDFKVADHCHLTGKFRGAAHRSCNLKYRIDRENFKVISVAVF